MNSTSQLILEFDHRPAYSGEDFLVAPNNSEAVGWIDRWPGWPAPALCIFGPPGCGKSHLAEVLRSKSEAVMIPLAELKGPYKPPPAQTIIIEDIDTQWHSDCEQGLFHLYNDLANQNGHLLFSAACPPSSWTIGLPDLKSRMGAAIVAEITPPDDTLIAAVMVKLFQDRQLRLSGDVITYAVSRMERSFASARRLVELSDKITLSEKKRITIPLIKRVLDQLDNEGDH